MITSLTRAEHLSPEPAEALAGLLGVAPPDPKGGALPLAWHWIYLLDRVPQQDLGPDGHPLRGVLPVPPGPGRRRMWAGGRIEMHAPLRIGAVAERRTTEVGRREKLGRTGRLTFVSVRHEIRQQGKLCVAETQEVVYREATPDARMMEPAAADDFGGALPEGGDAWEVPVTPTLLFRFSALTYNSHRIHYDREYAVGVEGYPGLVVHGPLQALVMAESARRCHQLPESGVDFRYRLTSALFEDQGMTVRAWRVDEGLRTLVTTASGRRTAEGTLERT